MDNEPGIGPTTTLDLRVSVAALVRLLLTHPVTGQSHLVLERTAALRRTAKIEEATVTARPLGGALRLLDAAALREAVGEFNYDSIRAREQGDFRLCVRREDWPRVQAFCLQHLRQPGGALEADPRRELAEEFSDSLGVDLQSEQYTLQQKRLLIGPDPSPTSNMAAAGLPTVRLYLVHSGQLLSPDLVERVVDHCTSISDEDLQYRAQEDNAQGGRGRANALLALPLDELIHSCSSISRDWQGQTLRFAGHLLESSVLALLAEVKTNRYLDPPRVGW